MMLNGEMMKRLNFEYDGLVHPLEIIVNTGTSIPDRNVHNVLSVFMRTFGNENTRVRARGAIYPANTSVNDPLDVVGGKLQLLATEDGKPLRAVYIRQSEREQIRKLLPSSITSIVTGNFTGNRQMVTVPQSALCSRLFPIINTLSFELYDGPTKQTLFRFQNQFMLPRVALDNHQTEAVSVWATGVFSTTIERGDLLACFATLLSQDEHRTPITIYQSIEENEAYRRNKIGRGTREEEMLNCDMPVTLLADLRPGILPIDDEAIRKRPPSCPPEYEQEVSSFLDLLGSQLSGFPPAILAIAKSYSAGLHPLYSITPKQSTSIASMATTQLIAAIGDYWRIIQRPGSAPPSEYDLSTTSVITAEEDPVGPFNDQLRKFRTSDEAANAYTRTIVDVAARINNTKPDTLINQIQSTTSTRIYSYAN